MKNSTKWFLFIMAGMLLLSMGVVFFFWILLMARSDGDSEFSLKGGQRIALVELSGVIVSSENIVRQLKKHREDRSIKAILLRIDSPGGGVVASQEIYEEVRKTRDGGKTVVVSM